MKTCKKCHLEKELDQFKKDKRISDGRTSWCRKCDYSHSNVIWNNNNPNTYRQSKAKWLRDNPAKRCAKEAKHRAAKLNATPKWLSKDQLKEIEQYYIDSAYIQQLTQTPMNVDHIVPLQGENVSGLHVPWNLQILTEEDNYSKGNKFNLTQGGQRAT